ncbi:MAG: hypothetical protein ABI353_19995 [Isosphaeraceae bacterium]
MINPYCNHTFTLISKGVPRETTMEQESIPPPRLEVTPEELVRLPLRMRIAYAAAMVEKSVGLYSEHFLRRFLQRDAIDYAWNFALGRADDPQRREALMKRIGELIQEDEEYDFTHVAPSALILEEIGLGDGLAAGNAVDYAAMNYADARFYHEGLDPSVESITHDDYQACSAPFREMASRTLRYASMLTYSSINTCMFDSFEACFDPLPERLRNAVTPEPPRHEFEKWRRQRDSPSEGGD